MSTGFRLIAVANSRLPTPIIRVSYSMTEVEAKRRTIRFFSLRNKTLLVSVIEKNRKKKRAYIDINLACVHTEKNIRKVTGRKRQG